jgi:hypothetical protein
MFKPGGRSAHEGEGLQPPKTEIKKKHIIDIMVPKVLRDFPFGQNQPLKSADD